VRESDDKGRRGTRGQLISKLESLIKNEKKSQCKRSNSAKTERSCNRMKEKIILILLALQRKLTTLFVVIYKDNQLG